jgi:short-subunit dehydrogenase
MPGATETDFFDRADMLDTKVGQQEKDDPRMVAKAGFDAMMAGRGEVITGCQNKLRSAIAHVMPADLLAERHRGMAQPQRQKRFTMFADSNGFRRVFSGGPKARGPAGA